VRLVVLHGNERWFTERGRLPAALICAPKILVPGLRFNRQLLLSSLIGGVRHVGSVHANITPPLPDTTYCLPSSSKVTERSA